MWKWLWGVPLIVVVAACSSSGPSQAAWNQNQSKTIEGIAGQMVHSKTQGVFNYDRPDIGKKVGDMYYCVVLSNPTGPGRNAVQYCGISGKLFAAVEEGKVVPSRDEQEHAADPWGLNKIHGRVLAKVAKSDNGVPSFTVIVDSITEIKAYPVDATTFYRYIETGMRFPLDRPQPQPSASSAIEMQRALNGAAASAPPVNQNGTSTQVIGIYEFAALHGRVVDHFMDPANQRGFVAVQQSDVVQIHAVDLVTYYRYVTDGMELPFDPPPLVPKAVEGFTAPSANAP